MSGSTLHLDDIETLLELTRDAISAAPSLVRRDHLEWIRDQLAEIVVTGESEFIVTARTNFN